MNFLIIFVLKIPYVVPTLAQLTAEESSRFRAKKWHATGVKGLPKADCKDALQCRSGHPPLTHGKNLHEQFISDPVGNRVPQWPSKLRTYVSG